MDSRSKSEERLNGQTYLQRLEQAKKQYRDLQQQLMMKEKTVQILRMERGDPLDDSAIQHQKLKLLLTKANQLYAKLKHQAFSDQSDLAEGVRNKSRGNSKEVRFEEMDLGDMEEPESYKPDDTQ